MTTVATCPSFIDLRAFAAEPAAPVGDPFGAGRRIVPMREAAIEAGVIDLTAGSGSVAPLAGDWWLFAATGGVSLSTPAGDVALAEGESCMLRSGTGFEWNAAEPSQLIYMRYPGSPAAQPQVTPIDLSAELVPSGAPLAELLIGETPSCRNHTDYRTTDGEFSAGVWDSTPYHRSAMRYGHCELMYLLKGSVTFVDEAGREGTFSKGDVFLVERGAMCSWESRDDVAKVWVIYRPVA